MYDCIIIGGGPAGLTAAVYAARKLLNVLIITPDLGGQVMWTAGIENYMGYQFIEGPELIAKFEEQVRNFPVEIKYQEVTGITVNTDQSFTAKTDGGDYTARTLILASGKSPRRLEVPGEQELTGRGVSYCATCDGPLFKGKHVAVVGGGNSAVQAAVELSNLADKVYIITRSGYKADPVVMEKMQQAANIEQITDSTPISIQGEKFVESISCRNAKTQEVSDYEVHGVFVEAGLLPNTEYVKGLLSLNQVGEIIVDCNTQTGIPGIFAAGDVTNVPEKQIVIAAGDGAKAALGVYNYLLHNKKDQ